MGYTYCRTCGFSSRAPGSGAVPDPSRKWWQFWRRVECPDCDGTGMMKPPGHPPVGYGRRLLPENINQRSKVDAKLMDAAPDLLAACELVALWMVGGQPRPHSDSIVLEQVKRAIQKAKG